MKRFIFIVLFALMWLYLNGVEAQGKDRYLLMMDNQAYCIEVPDSFRVGRFVPETLWPDEGWWKVPGHNGYLISNSNGTNKGFSIVIMHKSDLTFSKYTGVFSDEDGLMDINSIGDNLYEISKLVQNMRIVGMQVQENELEMYKTIINSIRPIAEEYVDNEDMKTPEEYDIERRRDGSIRVVPPEQ